MNVARLNFSHGTHEEQKAKLDMIRSVREELGLPIAILLDTRAGIPYPHLPKREDHAERRRHLHIYHPRHRGRRGHRQRQLQGPRAGNEPGDKILVNNGLVIFEVLGVEGEDIHCRVEVGGELSNRKSMSFPNKVLKQTYLSEQDKADLLFGIENGVDFIAASFVSLQAGRA